MARIAICTVSGDCLGVRSTTMFCTLPSRLRRTSSTGIDCSGSGKGPLNVSPGLAAWMRRAARTLYSVQVLAAPAGVLPSEAASTPARPARPGTTSEPQPASRPVTPDNSHLMQRTVDLLGQVAADAFDRRNVI